MRKLFLHIGFNKTGSTSLQLNLVKNSDFLSRQGFLYPNAPDQPFMQNVQHSPLSVPADDPTRFMRWILPEKRKTLSQAYSSLNRYIEERKFDTLILSSEGFGGLDFKNDRIQWLKKQFPDYSFIIIAYIRRQDSYFISAYQQDVKTFRTKPFDFVEYKNNQALYFGRRLAPWREEFGVENVIVRPCDPNFWPKGEVLFDFLKVIGVNYEGANITPPTNEGLDFRVVELMRRINRITEGNPKLRAILRKQIMAFNDSLGKDTKKMSLSFAQAEELRNHFMEDNIDALNGSGLSIKDFFPPPREEAEGRVIPAAFSKISDTVQH